MKGERGHFVTPFLLSLPERQPGQIPVFLLKTGNLSISWGITVKDAFHVIGWNMDVFLLRYALKQGISAGLCEGIAKKRYPCSSMPASFPL